MFRGGFIIAGGGGGGVTCNFKVFVPGHAYIAGLEIATNTVANATNFFSLATKIVD